MIAPLPILTDSSTSPKRNHHCQHNKGIINVISEHHEAPCDIFFQEGESVKLGYRWAHCDNYVKMMTTLQHIPSGTNNSRSFVACVYDS